MNKVCPSGLAAIAIADQMMRAGEIEVAVAGGMESMTNAPYVIPKAREGQRLGNSPMLDTMIHDGLWCAFDDRHMGEGTDAMNREYGVAREDQDAWAARSHARAADAWASGRFADEVVPVSVPQRKGEPLVVDHDEGIRSDTTVERLATLRPSFTEDGTVTAGNASQISDGAARRGGERATRRRLGLAPLARIEAYGMSADRFASLHTVPALALREGVEAGRRDRRRPGRRGDQRGVRRRGGARDADARCGRGDREPERGSGGARTPDRRERRADRPDRRVRDAAA